MLQSEPLAAAAKVPYMERRGKQALRKAWGSGTGGPHLCVHQEQEQAQASKHEVLPFSFPSGLAGSVRSKCAALGERLTMQNERVSGITKQSLRSLAEQIQATNQT
jgi:hypothetical protein